MKFFSDCFYNFRHVMSSDDDQPIVMEIFAGINYRGNLAVSVDLHDYDDPRYSCSTAAIVNSDDARRMARRHGIRFEQLPSLIADSMDGWRRIVNADFRQVRACFKEITECLLDEGCRFRIERIYGKNEQMCC